MVRTLLTGSKLQIEVRLVTDRNAHLCGVTDRCGVGKEVLKLGRDPITPRTQPVPYEV